ncbi:MAG: 1,4-dihydroxy-2-naphthoate polyprenyltransferase [Myxococcota bacterium]
MTFRSSASAAHASRRAGVETEVSLAAAWWMAIRPATLTAAFVPVLVGSAVAYKEGGFRVWPALAALIGACLIQIGTNLANDLFDFQKGADTEERLGPTRVVQAGILSQDAVKRAMIFVFALSVLVGLYLVWVGGAPVVWIGVLSILSGLAYTGGPFPLGYNGLGDLFVFVFFGLVAVCGTAYVQLGSVPLLSILAAVPVGALATAILVVNNVRDRETDVLVGKRTLVVKLGRMAGVLEYALMIGISYAIPLLLLGAGHVTAAILLPLITLPWALWMLRALVRLRGTRLNPVLVSTAKLLLVFGVLFALGIFF